MATTTTISADVAVHTLVNVFTVEPRRQRELVDVLITATEDVMRHLPGFVSANIHASVDGMRVVNYAQWDSEQSFRDMQADPAAREHMSRAAEIADAFDPHLYTVESVHHR